MPRRKLLQHGWLVSPYSAKTRAYFLYKGIPYEESQSSFLKLYWKLKCGPVNRIIMPAVQLPNNKWLQDSSDIIDYCEKHYSHAPSVVPNEPIQKVASSLLEVFGDEWLPMGALHYRWNKPKASKFALHEFASMGFPWLPVTIGKRLVQPCSFPSLISNLFLFLRTKFCTNKKKISRKKKYFSQCIR